MSLSGLLLIGLRINILATDLEIFLFVQPIFAQQHFRGIYVTTLINCDNQGWVQIKIFDTKSNQIILVFQMSNPNQIKSSVIFHQIKSNQILAIILKDKSNHEKNRTNQIKSSHVLFLNSIIYFFRKSTIHLNLNEYQCIVVFYISHSI